MVRQRFHGSDVDFCAWLRAQKDELPSFSSYCGFVASDVDVFVHRYLTEVDGKGATREIQGLMLLEVKTRGGDLSASQRDTLAKHNAFHDNRKSFAKWLKCQMVRHFGVSLLFLSGTDPDNSSWMQWGRFREDKVVRKNINRDQLFRLLRFELHPDNLQPRPFRFHHKTQEIVCVGKAPLGFEYEQIVIKRS